MIRKVLRDLLLGPIERGEPQKIDERHPLYNTNAVYGKTGVREVNFRSKYPNEIDRMHAAKQKDPRDFRSTITHPGFGGVPSERGGTPEAWIGAERSRICRELEEVARELVHGPGRARVLELRARLEKASAELGKLLEKLRA